MNIKVQPVGRGLMTEESLPYRGADDIQESTSNKQTLLVVDDDINALEAMDLFFSTQFNTIICDDAQQALKIFDDTKIDLVLLDINMPVMNGHEFCALLKRKPTTENIPVIFLTGEIDDDIEFRSLNIGAIDFMHKPVDLQTLRVKIENHMRLASHRQQLADMSFTDPLTGVANRRFIDANLARECQNASRGNYPIAIAVIDVDNFKAYNDTLGHQQGDICLRRVAEILSQTLRRGTDLFGRYGGEEFVAILPQADSEGTETIVDALVAAVEAAEIPHPSSDCSAFVTVSIGVATFVPDAFAVADKTPGELFDEADQKLYQAKAEGKNTYCL